MFAGKARANLSESTFQVLHYRVDSWPYPQTFDQAGKACWEQTLQLITKIHKLWTKKFNNIGPSGLCYKTFYGCKFTNFHNMLVFVPGKPSSIVHCLRARPGAYPRVEHLKGASIGQVLALPTNIRLGYKGLPGTNTLAYYENLLITDKKVL